MVDQVRELETRLKTEEALNLRLSNALKAIQRVGRTAGESGNGFTTAFCAGRMQQLAEFALHPDVLDQRYE